MINKKIIMSGLSIVTALSLMGTATFAAFTSQATNAGNTFSSGNADLQIALDVEGEGGEVFSDSIPGFTPDDLFPGYDEVFRFWLKNNSSSAIDLDLTSDISAYTDDSIGEVMANTLLLSWRCDTDGDGGLVDNTYGSEFSVFGWFDGGDNALGSLIPDEQMICEMRAQVPSTAGEEIEDLTVEFDVVYDGEQVI